jgi:hypothetical protein
MGADEGGSPYRLTFNDWLRGRLRHLLERSVLLGTRDRFAGALTNIEMALRTIPTAWGDPIRHRDGMRMTEYRRVYERILVFYAVHDVHPIVWLTAAEPLRRSGFWAGEG